MHTNKILFRSICPECGELRPVTSLGREHAKTALSAGNPLELMSDICGHNWPATEADRAIIERKLSGQDSSS